MDPVQPFQFKFGQDYGDWAKYAGLNRQTGGFAVAPPQVGIAQAPSFTDSVKKFGETMNDLTSGNFLKPFAPKPPVAPAVPGVAPTAEQPAIGTYNYDPKW
jgi:hypothetical protein